MSAEIKPCPFCGCEDINISHTTICGNGIARAIDGICIKCRNCGAMIADDESGIPARVRWNRREGVKMECIPGYDAWKTRTPPEPEPTAYCAYCGAELYGGDRVANIGGLWICDDCIDNCKEEVPWKGEE